MKYTRAYIPTLKEAPKDAVTPSHILLLRAGYIRMVGAGIYEMLPLGFRVLSKISAIVREEMNRAQAQEVLMPAILPREYFEESGRWDSFGDTLLRLKDRKGGDYHLGPTHEEIITDLVRRDVKSYRQLPLNLYQVQAKFRDEARPRAGLLRCREFIMKDAYSFDVSEEAAKESYESMRVAYNRIFTRIGLDYRMVAADAGAMGGSTSAEFQVLTQTGEDALVACTSCDFAANVEVAEGVLPAVAKPGAALEKLATPGTKTIEDLAKFLKVEKSQTVKALIVNADGRLVLCLLRGDHEANDVKLANALGAKEVRMAGDSEIRQNTTLIPGYASAVGYKGEVLVDRAVTGMSNAVVGANEEGFHYTNAAYGRDFEGKVVDIRQVGDGDACPKCNGILKSYRGIEGGHIFILGTHYSAKMKCNFLDEEGKEKPIVMGCYGIGVSRLIATAIEQHHDKDGIKWPMSIAPYQVIVSPAGRGDDLVSVAEKIYLDLQQKGIDVLYDDRDERPGVKFKDADLIGIPLRIVIGPKNLEQGKVEIKLRDEADFRLVDVANAADEAFALVQAKLKV